MAGKNNISRRQFLKVAGTAVGAIGFGFPRSGVPPYIVPASALGKAGNVAANERITMGCIGTGGQGTGNMRGFLGKSEVQVVAVCDVVESRRQEAKNIVDRHYGDKECAGYNDFHDVLTRKDIDAVMIATQDHWHALIAVAAARAGKDIYCEKPLGVAVREGQAIRDAVRRYGRVFQTGTQQRSDHKFRLACELARNGYLGNIHTVKVAAPGPKYKRTYSKPPTAEPIPAGPPDVWRAGLDYNMYIGPAPMKPYNGGRLAWPDWSATRMADWYLIWDHRADFLNCVRTRSDPVAPVEAGHKASYLGMIADIAARVNRKVNPPFVWRVKWDPTAERFVNDDEANRMLSRPMRSSWHL